MTIRTWTAHATFPRLARDKMVRNVANFICFDFHGTDVPSCLLGRTLFCFGLVSLFILLLFIWFLGVYQCPQRGPFAVRAARFSFHFGASVCLLCSVALCSSVRLLLIRLPVHFSEVHSQVLFREHQSVSYLNSYLGSGLY